MTTTNSSEITSFITESAAIIALDALVVKNTAFTSFADMLNTSPNYRPTIYTSVQKRQTASEARRRTENKVIADAYDAAMEMLNDSRRAYRC
jgi:hypothetical protein